MLLTTNLGLKKPELTDYVNVEDFNENADKLDVAINTIQTGSQNITSLETTSKTLAGAINELKAKDDSFSTQMAEKVNKPTTAIAGRVAQFDTNKNVVDSGYTIAKSVPSNATFTDTVYTHPTSVGNKHVPAGGVVGQILKNISDGTVEWGDLPQNGLKQLKGTTGAVAAYQDITVPLGVEPKLVLAIARVNGYAKILFSTTLGISIVSGNSSPIRISNKDVLTINGFTINNEYVSATMYDYVCFY